MNKLWNHILRRRSNVDSEKLRRNTENKKGWEFHPMIKSYTCLDLSNDLIRNFDRHKFPKNYDFWIIYNQMFLSQYKEKVRFIVWKNIIDIL